MLNIPQAFKRPDALSRELVNQTYIPPQIQNGLIDGVVAKYDLDYRRVYIEQPRLRLDGVYIAVCHYM